MDRNHTRRVVRELLEGKFQEAKDTKALEKELNIKSIWDNGGLTADRYTIVLNSLYNEMLYDNMFDALALDGDPGSPQGFSQMTGAREGVHLGKRVKFRDLPDNIQNHVIERLKSEEESMEGEEGEDMKASEMEPESEPMSEPEMDMEPPVEEPEER
jgi:hypothetical protein